MTTVSILLAALVAFVSPLASTTAASPQGQVTWAVHIWLAPTWFDPAEHTGIITPMMVL